MKLPRRTNFLLGLVALGLVVLVLARALGVIPVGIDDLVNRAWPVLLVVIGLAIFLRERIRFGGIIALVLGAGLVAGLTTVAFSNRSGQMRDDYTSSINQVVGAPVNLVRIQIQMLNTDIEITRSLTERTIQGEFVGSTESLIETTYVEAGDNTATLTILESRPNEFPLLESIGRGRFRLELPAGLPLDIGFSGQQGALSLSLNDLSVERLNVDLVAGDALVTLPEYDPLGSAPDASLGTLQARAGNITIRVPGSVGARFELNRGGSGLEPVYDSLTYNYLVGDVLEARIFETAAITQRYTIIAPRGVITLETTTPSGS
jgi:hypothetical protein